MTTRAKIIVGAFSAALVLFLGARAWSSLVVPAYFEGGRCACGHDVFIYRAKAGYLTYWPGHGLPQQRTFRLQPVGDGWDLLADPTANDYWPSVKPGQLMGQMRIRDGALYLSWNGSTNWTRHARLAEPWRIWFGPDDPQQGGKGSGR